MHKASMLVLVAVALGAAIEALAQGRRGAEVRLPEGEGKPRVEALCAGCHGLELISRSGGYTRQGWEELFGSMVALPAEEAARVAGYLAEHFPVRPRPAAVLIPGSATVSIKEWLAPTLGSRPHDPLAAPDGSIWWTGQWANVLDPETRNRPPGHAAAG
jgi:virginiamycin B lyase